MNTRFIHHGPLPQLITVSQKVYIRKYEGTQYLLTQEEANGGLENAELEKLKAVGRTGLSILGQQPEVLGAVLAVVRNIPTFKQCT